MSERLKHADTPGLQVKVTDLVLAPTGIDIAENGMAVGIKLNAAFQMEMSEALFNN